MNVIIVECPSRGVRRVFENTSAAWIWIGELDRYLEGIGSERWPLKFSEETVETNQGATMLSGRGVEGRLVGRRTHHLKTWPEYFEEVLSEKKTFEIRLNDRAYAVGDILRLLEFDPATQAHTGRECFREVTYLTDFGQKPNHVVLAIRRLF